jgi:hypothetical protein
MIAEEAWPPEKGYNGQTWKDSDGSFVNRGGTWYRDNGGFAGVLCGDCRYSSVDTKNTGGTPGYDGSSMLSSSNYDYSFELMPGKQADDMNYWQNGKAGAMLTRVMDTTNRDAWAEGNEATTKDAVATILLTPGRGGGVGRSTTGKFTEPTLPNKTIVNERGVKVEHYYKSGDHSPAHLHVEGAGASTKIGANGKPIKGSPELSKTQQSVINNNKSTIRSAGNKINNYQKYQNYLKNK